MNSQSYMNVNRVYGTDRVNAYKLIEDCLNLRATSVFDPIKDGSTTRYELNNPIKRKYKEKWRNLHGKRNRKFLLYLQFREKSYRYQKSNPSRIEPNTVNCMYSLRYSGRNSVNLFGCKRRLYHSR